MFQVFLIIFWATIRLQSRGHAVCDPSVGAADSSPWQGSQPLRSQATPSLKGKAEKITTPQWRTTAALLLCNITNSYNKRLSKCSKL